MRYVVRHYRGNVDLSPHSEPPRESKWFWWAAKQMQRRMSRRLGVKMHMRRNWTGYVLSHEDESVYLVRKCGPGW